MADVFNKKPTTYVDMNELFPVLNEKIGLTYEQWRTAIENSNYLKRNLVSEVAVGSIDVITVDNPDDADLVVTTREVDDNDKKTVYLDFIYYSYISQSGGTGLVESVNGQTGAVVLSADDVGAVSSNSNSSENGSITISRLSNENGITTITTTQQQGTTSPQLVNQVVIGKDGININELGGNFKYNGNTVATLADVSAGGEKLYRHHIWFAINDYLIYCDTIINKSQELFTLATLTSYLNLLSSKSIICNGYGRNNALYSFPYRIYSNGATVVLESKKLTFTIENSEVIMTAKMESYALYTVNAFIDTVEEV